jgi:hypothetical protein
MVFGVFRVNFRVQDAENVCDLQERLDSTVISNFFIEFSCKEQSFFVELGRSFKFLSVQ